MKQRGEDPMENVTQPKLYASLNSTQVVGSTSVGKILRNKPNKRKTTENVKGKRFSSSEGSFFSLVPLPS